jgi:hypothetical protein
MATKSFQQVAEELAGKAVMWGPTVAGGLAFGPLGALAGKPRNYATRLKYLLINDLRLRESPIDHRDLPRRWAVALPNIRERHSQAHSVILFGLTSRKPRVGEDFLEKILEVYFSIQHLTTKEFKRLQCRLEPRFSEGGTWLMPSRTLTLWRSGGNGVTHEASTHLTRRVNAAGRYWPGDPGR